MAGALSLRARATYHNNYAGRGGLDSTTHNNRQGSQRGDPLTKGKTMATKGIQATWTGGKGNWKAKVEHGKGKQGDTVTMVTRFGATSDKVLGEFVRTVTDFSGNKYDEFQILNLA